MPIKKKKSLWPKLLIIALLIGGGAFAYAKLRGKEGASTGADYRTNVVSRGDIVQAVTANGQLSPMKNVQVGSQVSGIIKQLFVDYNSRVTNGQVVAKIDPSTYEQNITQGEAELENAKAALLYAELNHKRAQDLKKSDLISAAEFDKTVVDLHQAQAVVRMREASLRRSNVDLERTTIYAPIDGVVISRAVDEGQTVAASFNAPTLFVIANDLRQMRIEALVSEADVGGIEEGQSVTFTVDAFPNRQFQGRVSQVRYAPITNQNVVNYTAIVEVRNDDLKLRPGMTASASVITAEKKNVLRIPNAALRFRPPEDATAKKAPAATNAPAGAPAGDRPRMMASDGAGGGGPGGGGERPNREEMRRRFESMSPEEREAFRARMGGGRGGSGGPGGARSQDGPVNRTIYIIDQVASASGKMAVKPVTVKLGISDGTNTEVIEGLKEGDVVAVGLNTPLMAQTPGAPQGSSPFGSPFGRGMGGGGGGGGRPPGR
ncbi:MAG TPA: efflux RND transporter periplasmic adaptor subunit [Methylomirabilota bacterium]|nr:efflux RND transporter periplasmic adaptor subunit [Methylomirabilota bacterium]